MLSTARKGTCFTELRAVVGRFAVYASIYLAATLTIGCLGLIMGSLLLTLPLAMLISNPVVWILIGVGFTVTYKLAIEPLFYWVKSYVNRKGTGKNISFGKEFSKDLQTLVYQTNRGNYNYWLQQHDIAHIARVKYGYSENSADCVFFCIPGNLETLNERLIEYKNRVEQEDREVTFTSVVNLENCHWTTLVVAYDLVSKQFRAYYCDSFGAGLPSSSSQHKNIECASEIKGLIFSLTKQYHELYKQGRKKIGQDVQKTLQTCRDKKNELVNVPINVDGIVSALEVALEIGSDNMRSFKNKQQNDSYNCGVFALENASKITQMFSKGKSFDEIDKELLDYRFNLNKKRREFTEALINDKKWREDLKNGLLCDLSPETATSQLSTSLFIKVPPGPDL